MISRLIQLTLTVLFSSLLSIGTADAYDANCTTPVEATKTLLKNLMGEKLEYGSRCCLYSWRREGSHSVKTGPGRQRDLRRLWKTSEYT